MISVCYRCNLPRWMFFNPCDNGTTFFFLFFLSLLCDFFNRHVVFFKISRPWDYPENSGICSQLDRKSKTWFFTFLNVHISRIERDKILISQHSPSKFRYFADQNGPRENEPHENAFWQFSNGKMSFLNS